MAPKASDLLPRHCEDTDDNYARGRATHGALHVGHCTDMSLRRDQNENENDSTNARSPDTCRPGA